MILKEEDLGRKVLYIPHHAHGDASHKDCEEGVLTSFNDSYAFVRYGSDVNSKPTDFDNLKLI